MSKCPQLKGIFFNLAILSRRTDLYRTKSDLFLERKKKQLKMLYEWWISRKTDIWYNLLFIVIVWDELWLLNFWIKMASVAWTKKRPYNWNKTSRWYRMAKQKKKTGDTETRRQRVKWPRNIYFKWNSIIACNLLQGVNIIADAILKLNH